MKQVRIYSAGSTIFEIDVQCSCGRNGLLDVETSEESFHHRVELGGKNVELKCQCGKQFLLRSQTNHVHVVEVPVATGDLSVIDWGTIHTACCHSKWYPLIRLIAAGKNQVLDLKHADNLIAREVRGARVDLHPASTARTYLNNLLRQADLPFRIQKIEKGRTCYEGVIQICRLKEKPS